MGFEWGRMEQTPEAVLRRRERYDRERMPVEDLSREYDKTTDDLLRAETSHAVHDEAARFAEKILSAREGLEQQDASDRLIAALRLRKVELPDTLDSEREKVAFAVSLARGHQRSLQ